MFRFPDNERTRDHILLGEAVLFSCVINDRNEERFASLTTF